MNICAKMCRCLRWKVWSYNTVMHAWIFSGVILFLVWKLPNCLLNLSFGSGALRFGKLLDVHCCLGNLLGRVVNISSTGLIIIHIGLRDVILGAIGVHFKAALSSCFYNWHTFSIIKIRPLLNKYRLSVWLTGHSCALVSIMVVRVRHPFQIKSQSLWSRIWPSLNWLLATGCSAHVVGLTRTFVSRSCIILMRYGAYLLYSHWLDLMMAVERCTLLVDFRMNHALLNLLLEHNLLL